MPIPGTKNGQVLLAKDGKNGFNCGKGGGGLTRPRKWWEKFQSVPREKRCGIMGGILVRRVRKSYCTLSQKKTTKEKEPDSPPVGAKKLAKQLLQAEKTFPVPSAYSGRKNGNSQKRLWTWVFPRGRKGLYYLREKSIPYVRAGGSTRHESTERSGSRPTIEGAAASEIAQDWGRRPKETRPKRKLGISLDGTGG